MTIHLILAALSRELNYPENPGCCHGFSLRCLEAFLLCEEKIFTKRIKKIEAHAPTFTQTIALIKNKKGRNLTASDRSFFDIHAFFDSMSLYHDPRNRRGLFNTSSDVSQLKMSLITKYAASDKIAALGGLEEIDVEPVMYTKKEFKKYLKSLSFIFDQSKPAKFNRTGMLLVGNGHTATLAYIPKKGWTFADINHYPPKFFRKNKLHLLLKKIALSFKRDTFFSFNIYTYTTGNNPNIPFIKNQLELAKKSRPVTAEMALRESDGINLLWNAARSGHIPTLVELAKYPTKYNIRRAIDLDTPVHVAAYFGSTDFLKELGEQSINFDLEDCHSRTPATYAASYGHSDFIAELGKPKYKVDLNAGNKKENNSPAHFAALNGYPLVIRELAKYHVDLNKRNNKGETPVFIAVARSDIEVIKELAKYGVNFNIPDLLGRYVTDVAAQRGDVKVIIEIAKYGANFNTLSNGLTPTFLAALFGHTDALVALMNVGTNWSYPSSVSINLLYEKVGIERASQLNDFLKTHTINNGIVQVTPFEVAKLMGHTATIEALNTTALKQSIMQLKASSYSIQGASFTNSLEALVTSFMQIKNDHTQVRKIDALRYAFQGTLTQLRLIHPNHPAFSNITITSNLLGLAVQPYMRSHVGFFNHYEKQYQDNARWVTSHHSRQVIAPGYCF